MPYGLRVPYTPQVEEPMETNSDAPEGYVRIQLTELQELYNAVRETNVLKAQVGQLKLQLANAMELKAQTPQEAQAAGAMPLIVEDPDAAIDAISENISGVRDALIATGFLPTDDEALGTAAAQQGIKLGPAEVEAAAQRATAARDKVRYAPIWAAAMENMSRDNIHAAEQRNASGKSGMGFIFTSEPGPRMLTPANVEVICQALETGISRRGAFALGGIAARTLDSYNAASKRGAEPYRTLFDLMEIAEARVEHRLIKRWHAHTQDSWQAAQALLAKRFVNEWGDKRVLELTMNELATLPPAKLAEVVGPDAMAWLAQQALPAPEEEGPPTLREEDFADQMELPSVSKPPSAS